MKQRSLLFAALFALSLTVSAARPDRWKDLTPEQVAVIEKAADEVKPQAKPAKRGKVLIASYAQGFWHNSIPFGAKALEIMGKKTGAYELVVAEDGSAFTPENLAKYDAVVVNNLTKIEKFIPDEAGQKALVDFVEKGGGLFANHSASDGGWPAYSELIGGRFNGHPWNAGGTWGFQVEECDHPLCKGLKDPQFNLKDEIYMLKDQFSRDTHRVLVSLDLSDEPTDVARKGGGRADRDFGVSMIRSFGKGRVFYSVFGHREDIHSNPMILQHYFDGMQYVLGDLKADDSPVPLQARLARFQTGRNYEVEHAYRNKIAGATDIDKAAIEAELLGVLVEETTYDAKALIMELLPEVWSKKSIGSLEALLTDVEHNQRALELYRTAGSVFKVPREEMLGAIRSALAKADVRAKGAIVNALALEGDVASVRAIAKIAGGMDASGKSANSQLAVAGTMALSQLGSEGLSALMAMKPSSTARAKHADAVLRAAETVSNAEAARVYSALLNDENQLAHVRDAGLIGLARVTPAAAFGPMRKAIVSGPSHLRRAAFFAASQMTGKAGTTLLLEAPANLSETEQLALVTALRVRADEASRRALQPLPAKGSVFVAQEAVAALAAIGTKDDVLSIFAALQRDDDAAEDAVDALAATSISGADEVLIAAAKGASVDVLEGLAEVFRERRAFVAAPLLMNLRQHEDSGVSREAWRALAYCATEKQLPALLGSLKEASARDGARIQKVIVAIGQRRGDDKAMSQALLAQIGSVNTEGRHVILDALAAFQQTAGLVALRKALGNDEDRSVALKALAKWKTAEPLTDLYGIVSKSQDKSDRVLGMRAYAQVLQLQHGALAETAVTEWYQKAFDVAKHPEELVALLSAVADAPGSSGMKNAARFLEHEDDNVHAMAWRAVASLFGGTGAGKLLDSSHGQHSTKALVDQNPATRWSTGTPMKPGMWLSVNLGKPTKLETIILDNTNPKGESRNDFPRQVTFFVSNDGSDWKPVDAKIKEGTVTTITCDVTAQHFRVVNGFDSSGSYWSIHELHVNKKGTKLATPKMISKDAMTVNASEQPKQAKRAIDGNDRNAWATGKPMSGKEWFEATFDQPRKVSRVVVDCKRKGELQSRGFALSVTTDGKRWSPPLYANKGGSSVDVSIYPFPVKGVRVLQTMKSKKYTWGIGELQLYEVP